MPTRSQVKDCTKKELDWLFEFTLKLECKKLLESHIESQLSNFNKKREKNKDLSTKSKNSDSWQTAGRQLEDDRQTAGRCLSDNSREDKIREEKNIKESTKEKANSSLGFLESILMTEEENQKIIEKENRDLNYYPDEDDESDCSGFANLEIKKTDDEIIISKNREVLELNFRRTFLYWGGEYIDSIPVDRKNWFEALSVEMSKPDIWDKIEQAIYAYSKSKKVQDGYQQKLKKWIFGWQIWALEYTHQVKTKSLNQILPGQFFASMASENDIKEVNWR
jgi:hypothetical protein